MIAGVKKRVIFFLVNKIFSGTRPCLFEFKRFLLNLAGYEIGEATKIVGPLYCTGNLKIGKNCWIGKNLMINGNGNVEIGSNCDIAPEVSFQTGGHEIGSSERRAGKGKKYTVVVEDGCWIGARSTILGNITIGESSVVAACACVCDDVTSNSLVGGVPARMLKDLSDEKACR